MRSVHVEHKQKKHSTSTLKTSRNFCIQCDQSMGFGPSILFACVGVWISFYCVGVYYKVELL